MNSLRSNQILKVRFQQAQAEASLSYARRLKVGALLIKDDRIIAQGRNGTPSGRDNNCEIVTKRTLEGPFVEKELKTKPEVVHAEMNVIAFAAKNGVSTNKCIMIITHSPCFECSKLIVQSGISEVYYDVEYRKTEGIDFLRECNIKVGKL